MKKLSFLLLAVPALFIASCNNNDDDTKKAIGLQGDWNLVSIDHPMVGEKIVFNDGDVTWKFNEGTTKLTVVKTTANTESLDSGSYNYSLGTIEEACDQSLTVADTNYGCITIDGSTLIVSSAYVDGNIYTFIR